MLPDDTISSLPIMAAQESPVFWQTSPTESFSRSLSGAIWKCWFNGTHIVKAPESNLADTTTLMRIDKVDELSFALDQNSRDVVSVIVDKVAKIYWFSPVSKSYTLLTLGNYMCGILNMDERRQYLLNQSDVIFLGMNSTSVVAHYQRERFLKPHVICPRPQHARRIHSFGMNAANRMQWSYYT